MRIPATPLLTREVGAALAAARGSTVECSLDLGVSRERVPVGPDHFRWREREWPLPPALKERTVYYLEGGEWQPVARFGRGLFKLVPTEWGPPTFEIDGIKMLPTSRRSPLEDAREKVALVSPRGRRVLDTCGGLGYFARCCLEAGAAEVRSFEKYDEVLWLRSMNPWSPAPDAARLVLTSGDVAQAVDELPARRYDAALHDPPRFGIAGDLYSQRFYDALARVLVPGAPLFHYTGTPNALTSGRDVPGEVLRRLQRAGFSARRHGDGVLAVNGGGARR